MVCSQKIPGDRQVVRLRGFSLLMKPSDSGFDPAGNQILLNHKGNLKGDGIVELPQIQAGELLDLFQTVHQGVPVDKELTGSLRHV